MQRAAKLWASGYEDIEKSFMRPRKLNLQERDIVFLRKHEFLTPHDYDCLARTGYLPRAAAGHPVIVLHYEQDSTHAIVTTVSAYSSGADNNNLAPWNQSHLRRMGRGVFRAFQGSERPDNRRASLQLEDGKLMPKPKCSWVNTSCAFVVPITALQRFDKSDTRLRMTSESLMDLSVHMRACLQTHLRDPRLSYTFVNGHIQHSSAKVPIDPKTGSIPTPTSSAAAWNLVNKQPESLSSPRLSHNISTPSVAESCCAPGVRRQAYANIPNTKSWANIAACHTAKSWRVTAL